jgi:hypothetical protein
MELSEVDVCYFWPNKLMQNERLCPCWILLRLENQRTQVDVAQRAGSGAACPSETSPSRPLPAESFGRTDSPCLNRTFQEWQLKICNLITVIHGPCDSELGRDKTMLGQTIWFVSVRQAIRITDKVARDHWKNSHRAWEKRQVMRRLIDRNDFSRLQTQELFEQMVFVCANSEKRPSQCVIQEKTRRIVRLDSKMTVPFACLSLLTGIFSVVLFVKFRWTSQECHSWGDHSQRKHANASPLIELQFIYQFI